MKQKEILLLLSLLLFEWGNGIFAQKTYLYKRVMIVKNGTKTNKYDDAHYITFTDKGCYESDKDGFTTNNGFVKFTKNENNMHCYYGSCSFGTAHYYFSNDYSRLNVRLDDNITYVYQRELSGKTTASRRPARSNSSSSSGSGVYVAPPPVINNGGGSIRSSSGNSNSHSSSIYQTCKYCKGTGVCTRCKGKCGEWKFVYDSESWISCSGCNGSGRCSICRGTGRL